MSMGYELMQAAMVHGAHLPGNAFKVLMRMSHQALDKPNSKGQPPRLYFAGWAPLMLALGRDPDDPSARASNEETVRKALADLKSAGLIEDADPSSRARTGTRGAYRLTDRLAPTKSRGSRGDSPKETLGHYPKETLGHQPQGNLGDSPNETLGPRKEEEPQQDSGQDPNSTSATTVTARASCGHRVTRDGDCIRGCESTA